MNSHCRYFKFTPWLYTIDASSFPAPIQYALCTLHAPLSSNTLLRFMCTRLWGRRAIFILHKLCLQNHDALTQKPRARFHDRGTATELFPNNTIIILTSLRCYEIKYIVKSLFLKEISYKKIVNVSLLYYYFALDAIFIICKAENIYNKLNAVKINRKKTFTANLQRNA